MTPTWALIATKNRPQLVRNCLRSLAGQVSAAVVMDNNDEPDAHLWSPDVPVLAIHHPGYPPNLSVLYNRGLDAIEQVLAISHESWNVALLNDDVEVPAGWTDALTAAMRGLGAAAAYVDRLGRETTTLYTSPPRTPEESMTAWACVLRGERCPRFDETMRWWYNDTDLDYRLRRAGGVLAVPGQVPAHHHPGLQTTTDQVLLAQTDLDRQTFQAKWPEAAW